MSGSYLTGFVGEGPVITPSEPVNIHVKGGLLNIRDNRGWVDTGAEMTKFYLLGEWE